MCVRQGFPDITRHPGFEIIFQSGPRPRYLGRLTDNHSLLDLEQSMPMSSEVEPEEVEDWSFPAFRRKMKTAILAGKNRQKAAKDKRRKDRVVTKRGCCAQLRRAQCYLGVRSVFLPVTCPLQEHTQLSLRNVCLFLFKRACVCLFARSNELTLSFLSITLPFVTHLVFSYFLLGFCFRKKTFICSFRRF